MSKLIIRYSEDGEVVADLKISKWLDEKLELFERRKETNALPMAINIGSVVMFDAIRLAILRERINHEEVTIDFKGQEWKIDKNARCEIWPEGFCDTYMRILEHLMEVRLTEVRV